MVKTIFNVERDNDTIVVNKTNNLDITSVLKYNFKKFDDVFYSRTIVFKITETEKKLTMPVSIGRGDFSFNLDNVYHYTYQNIIDLSLNEFSENIKKNHNDERGSIKSMLTKYDTNNELSDALKNKILDDPDYLDYVLSELFNLKTSYEKKKEEWISNNTDANNTYIENHSDLLAIEENIKNSWDGKLHKDTYLVQYTYIPIYTLTGNEPKEYEKLKNKIFNDTNNERNKIGLPQLSQNILLDRSAVIHSEGQHICKETSHSGCSKLFEDKPTMKDRITDIGYVYSVIRENVAGGTKQNNNIVDSWMNSEGHKKNILSNDITEIGIGIKGDWDKDANIYRNIYYTQKFGKPSNSFQRRELLKYIKLEIKIIEEIIMLKKKLNNLKI